MEDHRGLSVWMTADLPVDVVPVADIERTVLVRFDFWVQNCHIILSPEPAIRVGLGLAVSY